MPEEQPVGLDQQEGLGLLRGVDVFVTKFFLRQGIIVQCDSHHPGLPGAATCFLIPRALELLGEGGSSQAVVQQGYISLQQAGSRIFPSEHHINYFSVSVLRAALFTSSVSMYTRLLYKMLLHGLIKQKSTS